MKVILTKDCKDGKANTIIETSQGYAKNFLIKNGFAVPINENNKKELEIRKAKEQEIFDENYSKALDLKSQIEKIELKFSLKVTNDVIHGSITHKKINQALIEKGIKLDKHSISNVHIASIGISKIDVKLFDNVHAFLKVLIEKE